MIVGLDAVERGLGPDLAGEFAGVGAETHHPEAEFGGSDASGGERMGGVAEDEDPLVREIGRIDRA